MAKDNILGVIDILNEYKQDIQEGIAKSAEEVAKHGRDDLKRTSPVRLPPVRESSETYAKGWSVHASRTMYNVETIIHNKTNYQLTHLLEKEHAKRNGETSTPIEHIKPVEEKCIAEFEKYVESVIENGGKYGS